MSTASVAVRLAVIGACAFATAAPLGQPARDSQAGHVISGRVADPHGLHPEDAQLLLWHRVRQPPRRDESFGPRGESWAFHGDPIPVAADGSFTTARVGPGRYVLEMSRTPHSATRPAQLVALTALRLGTTDVSGVTVEVRPDTALTGRFRMESDNPRAEWPTDMFVMASLAFDGEPHWVSKGAEGGPGGTFVLRNAFGPRVLRANFSPTAGSNWWFSRVMLDGKDVTNVPTDFSEHPNGQLEIVLTQHPASIAGAVTDAEGRPVPMAWVTFTGAGHAGGEAWATTSGATRTGASGRFDITLPPGTYRVNALPADRFSSYEAAREGMSDIAFGGVTVVLAPRGRQVVAVPLQAR